MCRTQDREEFPLQADVNMAIRYASLHIEAEVRDLRHLINKPPGRVH